MISGMIVRALGGFDITDYVTRGLVAAPAPLGPKIGVPCKLVIAGGVPIEAVLSDNANGFVPIFFVTDNSQAVPVRVTAETFNNLVPTITQ